MSKKTCLRDWDELDRLLLRENRGSDSEATLNSNRYIYRGVSNHQYRLTPSLYRFAAVADAAEKGILRDFSAESSLSHPGIDTPENFWKCMVLGQHFGLPTRLLDWTESPYVALHFATDSRNDFVIPGIVWRLDVYSLGVFSGEFRRCVGLPKEDDILGIDQLQSWCGDIDKLHALDRDGDEQFRGCCLFRPPVVDNRVSAQASIFSIPIGWKRPLDELFLRKQLHAAGALEQFVITPELKWTVRSQLLKANLKERFFFPGLEGIAKSLHWKYCSPFPRISRRRRDDDGHDIVIDFSYAPQSPLQHGWTLFGVGRSPGFDAEAVVYGNGGRTALRTTPERHAGQELTYALDLDLTGIERIVESVTLAWKPISESSCFYIGLYEAEPFKRSPIEFAEVYEDVDVWLKFDCHSRNLTEGTFSRSEGMSPNEYAGRPVTSVVDSPIIECSIDVQRTLSNLPNPRHRLRKPALSRLRFRGEFLAVEVRITERAKGIDDDAAMAESGS